MLSFASGMNCLRQQNKLRKQGWVSLLYQGRKKGDSQSPGQSISHTNQILQQGFMVENRQIIYCRIFMFV